MTRQFPTYDNPVMVYTAKNEYAVIPQEELDSALAAGWFTEPQSTDVVTAFLGELVFEPVKEKPKGNETPSLDKLNKAELLAKAAELGLEVTDKQTKAEIVEAILAAEKKE
jgi:hypothetical protein